MSAGILAAALTLFATPAFAGSAPAIVEVERVFVDASRPTRANGTFPGAPDRTLRALIWYPSDCVSPDRCAPYPLLLLAHGFGGLPEKFDALATFIASNGYVVAAPAFPLTNQNAPGGHLSGFGDSVEQPEDLAFFYDELAAASAATGDELEGRVDPSATVALGHSLGGLTVFAWAHSNCCRQSPLRGAILVSALWVLNPFGASLHHDGPPTMVVHGTNDLLISFDQAEPLLRLLPSPGALVGVTGAGHSDLLESQTEPPIAARDATQRAVVAFLGTLLRGDREALDATLDELAGEGNVVIAPSCVADCADDGTVSIVDVVLSVRIALGEAPLDECPPLDSDRSSDVAVTELISAVANSLGGECPL